MATLKVETNSLHGFYSGLCVLSKGDLTTNRYIKIQVLEYIGFYAELSTLHTYPQSFIQLTISGHFEVECQKISIDIFWHSTSSNSTSCT